MNLPTAALCSDSWRSGNEGPTGAVIFLVVAQELMESGVNTPRGNMGSLGVAVNFQGGGAVLQLL